MLACSRRVVATVFTIVVFTGASLAQAHVDWTRVNDTDIAVLGLYHFDTTDHLPGEYLRGAGCLSPKRDLLIGPATGAGMTTLTDTPEPIFNPRSLFMSGAQTAETAVTLHHADSDLTIEFWLKWDSSMTSSSIEIGLRSSAKLRITRSLVNSAVDQFGISATHGDFRSAAGFTNWADVGVEEAPLNEWIHFAMTVHSTGMHFDGGLNHYIYNPGSTARFYLNGHLAGTLPGTIDISGMRAHDASKLSIRNLAGTAHVDEVTVWAIDWSGDGAVVNPFADGRGSGACPPLSNLVWTRSNEADPFALGVYQMSSENQAIGETLEAAGCLPPDRGLVIQAPTGQGLEKVHDTPQTIFDPHSVRFWSVQTAQSVVTLGPEDAGGDLTIETWFKWDASLTSSSLELGLRSGAKLRLTRDTVNPANDQFGIGATHGDFISAPGFVDWPTAGAIDAPLGEWLHAAMTIQSTGFSFDAGLNHDVYNSGTTARFWLNGNLVGGAAAVLDIGGIRAHDASAITVRSLAGGGVLVDEFTVWKMDWSNDGAVQNPFADGRGNGGCNGADDWQLFE